MVVKVDTIHQDWSLKDQFHDKIIYIMIKLDETVTGASVIENEEGMRWLKLDFIPTRAYTVYDALGDELTKQGIVD